MWQITSDNGQMINVARLRDHKYMEIFFFFSFPLLRSPLNWNKLNPFLKWKKGGNIPTFVLCSETFETRKYHDEALGTSSMSGSSTVEVRSWFKKAVQGVQGVWGYFFFSLIFPFSLKWHAIYTTQLTIKTLLTFSPSRVDRDQPIFFWCHARAPRYRLLCVSLPGRPGMWVRKWKKKKERKKRKKEKNNNNNNNNNNCIMGNK